MNKQPVPFGEWMPDSSGLIATAREAKGVFSMGGRYMPLRGAQQYGPLARLTDRCIGAFGAKASNGQVVNFFGDRNNLYRMVGRSLVAVSRPGGYEADRDAAWRFDQFNNYVIGACRGAPVQVLELGGTGEFQDLGGGAGEGDTCGRIGPHFLVAQGNELRISAFNNPTDYEPAPDTQAALAFLDQRGGAPQAILGGTDVGVVFQERMISRMAYVGGVTSFDLTPIEFNRGCLGPLAVAQLGRMAFYASEEGIFLYDGAQSLPIGANKVDRYFASKLNYGQRNRVCCAVDTERKCLVVAFPTGSNPDITEMLVYSIPDQRWTHDDYTGQMLFEMPRGGVSVDDRDAVAAIMGQMNASASGGKAVITSPPPGGAMSGSVTFNWTAGQGVTAYWLRIGSSGAGSNDIHDSGTITTSSRTVAGLPAGSVLYVRLYSLIGGQWRENDYTYNTITNVDLVNISVDSPIWRETRKQWAAVDADRYVVILDGPTRPAILETAEVELVPGRKAVVTELLPVTDAAPAVVSAQAVSRLHRYDETAVSSPIAAMNQYGICPTRVEARYLRSRVNIAEGAGWTEAVGVHTDARAAGGGER